MHISLHQDHVITPRSILRHRPIGDGSTTLTPLPTVPERASRTQTTGSPATRTSQTRTTETHTQRAEEQTAPLHWLGFVGLGMCAMVMLALLLTLVVPWGETVWQQLEYGYPRTFQTNAFVGAEHGSTPSHFLALNVNGTIEVFEVAGGDATQTHVYIGPHVSGPHADQVPVTLQFVVHGDPRYPEMVVHVGQMQVLYVNRQGVFEPQ